MNIIQDDIRHELLVKYKKEFWEELNDILSYWMNYAIDDEMGGFYGSINNKNTPDKNAPKGVVLCSRILWTFSSAFQITKKLEHYQIAKRAYDYILNHFLDKEFGGVYWSVDATGKIQDGKKQIYGLAFCIYGLSEYFRISKEKNALDRAIDLYAHIEFSSFDKEKNGYLEAFSREWEEIEDLRLSEKDSNERKTMNTHLHIIEAYANLYSVWSDAGLRIQIINLLWLFEHYFFNKQINHYNLFFDEDWNKKSNLQSYGHDIEAAWLLQQCAEIINCKEYIEVFKKLAIPVTDKMEEGLDVDGGLWYEFEKEGNHLIYEKHSWPQAEAIIGFYNAYQLTGNEKYLKQSLHSWEFVKKYIKDKEKGEWFWGVYKDYPLMQKDKAGFWKCPYHNGRACMELLKRIDQT